MIRFAGAGGLGQSRVPHAHDMRRGASGREPDIDTIAVAAIASNAALVLVETVTMDAAAAACSEVLLYLGSL